MRFAHFFPGSIHGCVARCSCQADTAQLAAICAETGPITVRVKSLAVSRVERITAAHVVALCAVLEAPGMSSLRAKYLAACKGSTNTAAAYLSGAKDAIQARHDPYGGAHTGEAHITLCRCLAEHEEGLRALAAKYQEEARGKAMVADTVAVDTSGSRDPSKGPPTTFALGSAGSEQRD
jgi:hypothetical protein